METLPQEKNIGGDHYGIQRNNISIIHQND
jgi:hypothetical protein